MNSDFRITQRARRDIGEIWSHLRSDESVATANRVIARIYSECKKLGEMPGIGHYREELLDTHHRFWKVWSYLIVYKWEAKPIEVIAVVHGARNLDWFFEQERA